MVADSNLTVKLDYKCMYLDDNEQLWVGTNKGLFLFNINNSSFNTFQVRHQLPFDPENNLVLSICPGQGSFKDCLWVGTETGLALFNMRDHSFHIFRKEFPEYESMSNNVIKKIGGIIDGRLWLGTDEGLMLMDTGSYKFSNYRHDPFNETRYKEGIVCPTTGYKHLPTISVYFICNPHYNMLDEAGKKITGVSILKYRENILFHPFPAQ